LQRAATEQGFGPTFKKANDTYSTFKRELGVGQMADFVEASNVSEQTTLDRMSKLLSPKQGETILKLLKVAGVDVSGLQSLSQEAETTADNATQTVKDITKQNTSQISQIQKDAAATVSKIGKENAIIPGGSNLDLAGKTTTEIRRQALLKLANNARKAGITNPSAFIQLTIGMLRMAAGSAMGTFQVASGGSKLGIQDLLQRKSFQDWMIQESGVTPSAAPAFRSAIASSADAITKLAQSTVLPRAIDASNQVRTLTPQPVTPIRPNRIAIAP
jgi:hypothetical protein